MTDGRARARGRVRIAFGVAAAALLMAAAVAGDNPGRLAAPSRFGRGLYDGVVPLAPYRWVHPPAELARDNQPPERGRATRDLDPTGRSPGAVATPDAQCTVIFNDGSIAAGPLGSTITVSITPVDPGAIGPPPRGTRFDGNACRYDAVYGKTATAPTYARPITIVLRYATSGAQIMRASPGGTPAWQPVHTAQYGGHLQLLVADVTALGTFAPVAPAGTPYVRQTPWAAYGVAAAAVVFAGLLLLRRRPRRIRYGRRR